MKFKNCLIASAIYVTAVALLYGFTATISLQKVSLTRPGQRHWGGGMTGRGGTSVKSDAQSLIGGEMRHGTYVAFKEGKGFGGSEASATAGGSARGSADGTELRRKLI